MTNDELLERIERAPQFRLPCLVWVRLPAICGPLERQHIGRCLGELSESTGHRLTFLVTGDGADGVALSEAEASDHQLVDALLAVKRRPSVQDQMQQLREKFLIVPRESLGGASLTKL